MAVTKKFLKYLNEGFADIKNYTHDTQIIRTAIMAELDAISFYEQLATKCENETVREVLLDIAYEEKVHVAELEYLLEDLDLDYEKASEEGSEEAEDLS